MTGYVTLSLGIYDYLPVIFFSAKQGKQCDIYNNNSKNHECNYTLKYFHIIFKLFAILINSFLNSQQEIYPMNYDYIINF